MNDPECCCCDVETVVEFGELDDTDDPASTSASTGDDECEGHHNKDADDDPGPDDHDDHDDPDGPDGPDPTDSASLANWITRAIHRVLRVANINRGHLSIAIVSDEQMIDLHQRYLDDPTTTDVLTFDLRNSDDDDPADTDTDTDVHDDVHIDADDTDKAATHARDSNARSAHSIFGEIIACFDEAKRQAVARDHDIHMELLLYIVHGLLHLLGFDDHDPDEASRMHQREDEWLIQAGFNPVYRTDPQP